MLFNYKNSILHYTTAGNGPAIVLLHGFLENISIWNPFIDTLAQKNKVVCVDLLGHGKSGCLGYIHTMEDMAMAVHAVLTHLNIEKYTVIGHSMGGYVALALVEIFPTEVKGLCLVNSTAKEDSKERKHNRDRAILAAKENHNVFIGLSIPNLFAPHNKHLFTKEINHLKKEALTLPVQGIIAALEGMKSRPNREHILHWKNFKMLAIVGKQDPIINYKESVKQFRNTQTDLVIFPGGHMSFIENESLFLQRILHFVENI